MAKRKIQSTVSVADGAGGLVPVDDLRFDSGAWPIHFTVAADWADHWIAHLNVECSERGWHPAALSQLGSDESSGTLIIRTENGSQSPTLELIWERRRGGPIDVKARPGGCPPLSLETGNDLIEKVRQRCAAGTSTRLHRRTHLTYEGLPWRGELWLADDLCLSPPSQYPPSLIGPQIVVVDAMVDGFGWQGVNSTFALLVRELSLFMSVVTWTQFDREKVGSVWTFSTDKEGKFSGSELRPIGYWEKRSDGMPKRGDARAIPTEPVQRPDLEASGINVEDEERSVPADIDDLWLRLSALSVDLRDQFLRSANAYYIARSMWPDQKTAYAAFMVVACEALKPAGRRSDHWNVYDVVEALLGSREAQRLRQLPHAPQRVRSGHLHRGQLAGDEFIPFLLQTHFRDPSFDEMLSALTRTARMCLIEWLRRGGRYAQPDRTNRRRRKN
jgi:hypothetical protein